MRGQPWAEQFAQPEHGLPVTPWVSLHTGRPSIGTPSLSLPYLPPSLAPFTSIAKQQRKRRSSINAYRGGKQDSPQQQQQQQEEEAAPTPKSVGRKSGKKSSRKSSSKKGRAAAEAAVEAAQQQQEEEEQRGVAFGEVIMHDIIAEAGEAPGANADEEPELKVEVAVEPMDAEASATAAATAALYQAALSFAQPALQKKAGSSVASTPVRKSTGGFLLPTASSSVKKRNLSTSSFSATLTSSSVPDSLSLCASTPAWRPSSAHPTPQTNTLTVPFSPKFRVDARSKTCARPVPLSTSEREAAQMDEDRRKLHEQIRRSQEHFLRSKAAAAHAREREQEAAARPRSTKELTVPHTPTFALDKRHGKKTAPPPAEASDEAAAGSKASFKPNKRLVFDDEAAPAPAHNGPKKPTQFEPFKFATDARLAARQTAEAPKPEHAVVVPAAEVAAKFLQNARQYDAPKTTACKGVTIPMSPHFSKRPSSHPRVLSTEEREAALMEEAKKNSFKAKPVDRRVFESTGELGVPRVAVKAPTEFKQFTLRTESRAASAAAAAAAAAAASSAAPASAFKARPMPDFQQQELAREVPSTPSFKPTVAVSPRFSTKRAASAPPRRQLPHHADVEKAKEREREEAYAKASSRPTITNPAPFALRSVSRHHDSLAQFGNLVKSIEAQLKEGQFKAQPLPKTTFEAPPQTPKASADRPPLIPSEVHLASEARAAQRAAFDAKARLQIESSAAKKMAAKSEAEEQENRELATLRRKSSAEGGFIFKAQPVQYDRDLYPTKHVAPKPPTMPKSPMLLTKQRAQTRPALPVADL